MPILSRPNARPWLSERTWLGEPATVRDASSATVHYRAVGFALPPVNDQQYYLVAWMSLDDVDETFRRVVLVELLVTGGPAAAARRDGQPGHPAGAAARSSRWPRRRTRSPDGDLDRRVEASDPSTEIGRLGVAFNGMLDGIGTLLDERTRSEDRLRQFVADASHELRTPVAAVRGYADLYQAGALPDAASVQRAMQRVGFEARRMGALVEDLLTLIQADAERTMAHERVDLADLLSGVVDDAAVIDPHRTWRLAARAPTHRGVGRPAPAAPAVRQSAGQRPHPHARRHDLHGVRAVRRWARWRSP